MIISNFFVQWFSVYYSACLEHIIQVEAKLHSAIDTPDTRLQGMLKIHRKNQMFHLSHTVLFADNTLGKYIFMTKNALHHLMKQESQGLVLELLTKICLF